MKRILVLALALVVAVTSLAVPSYATEYPAQQINLMDTYAYTLFRNNVQYTLETPATPSFWVNNVTSAAWEWEHDSAVYFERIVFTIEVQKAPSSVYFKTNVGSYAAAELVHVEGNVYQFVYDHVILVSSTLGVKAEWADSYSGRFNLISCVGYSDNYFTVDSVNWFANAVTSEIGWDEWGEGTNFEWIYISAGSGTDEYLPFGVGWNELLPGDNVLYYGEAFLKIPFDTFQFLDNVRITLYSAGDITGIGARLENSSGVVAAGLKSELIYCGETQQIFELAENMVRIKCYVLDVDVSGYDLRDLTLSVSSEIDRVYGSSAVEQGYGFYFGCESVAVYPPVNIENPLVYFSLWLGGQFKNIDSWIHTQTDAITSGLATLGNNINSWIETQTSAITSGLSTLGNNIDSWIKAQTDSLVDLFSGNDDLQQGIQDQIDDFDKVDDVIDSVTTPEVDNIDTDISHVVSTDQINAVSSLYSSFFGISFLADFVAIVAILGLASFLIYGKR